MASVQLAVLHDDVKEEVQNVDAVGNGGRCVKVEESHGLSCMNNSQDHAFNIEDAGKLNKDDVAAAGIAQSEAHEYGSDSTSYGTDFSSVEYSSSIKDSFSDHEDSLENDSSNAGGNPEYDDFTPFFDGWNRVFRKRKVTDHWRWFIQPVMWRCKWIELKVKQLQSQVARYDRELLALSPQNSEEIKLPHNDEEEEAAGTSKNKMYHRRKRRKIEDMVDFQTYLSQHVLFSYFDDRPEVGGLSFDEAFRNRDQRADTRENIALAFEYPKLKIKGRNKFLERILKDIESTQIRVLSLKARLSKINVDNVAGFYTPGTFIPGDANYRPSLSPMCSPIHNGGAVSPEAGSNSQHAHGLENENLVVPGNAVSNYGDADHPNIIGNTVGLLSSGIIRLRDNVQVGSVGADVVDDILTSNQVAEKDVHRFKNVRHPQTESLGALVAEKECGPSHMVSSSSETETDPEIAPAVVGRKPTLRCCSGGAAEFHLRRSKRKRKMRKASPGSWNGQKIRKRKQSRKRS